MRCNDHRVSAYVIGRLERLQRRLRAWAIRRSDGLRPDVQRGWAACHDVGNAPALRRYVPESRNLHADAHLDVPGAVLVLAAVALTWVLTAAAKPDGHPGWIAAAGLGSTLLFAGFWVEPRKAPQP